MITKLHNLQTFIKVCGGMRSEDGRRQETGMHEAGDK